MGKILKYIHFFAIFVAFAALSATAMAQPGKAKGKGKAFQNDQVERSFNGRDFDDDDFKGRRGGRDFDDDDDVRVRFGFGDRDRDVIRDYLRREYAPNCPPGLAKKNNGCLPPGIAKKYRVGATLPPYIGWDRPPRGLLDLLGPAPNGTFYGQVDKDILLISEAGRKVLDAVTIMGAVN